MIKFEAEPRMKIGDKVWVAVENQKTGEITTEKALIVGYRISVVVTNAFQDMAVQYLTILASIDHKEVNVHKIPLDYYLKHGDLFESVIVDEEFIYCSEQEVPGVYLN